MTERFAKWKFPAIKEGCLTKYHWLVQHKNKLIWGIHLTDVVHHNLISNK